MFEWLTLMFCVRKYLTRFSEPLKCSWLQCLLRWIVSNRAVIPSVTTTSSYTPVDHWTLFCSSRSLREPNTGPCFVPPVVGTHRFVSQNYWLFRFIRRVQYCLRRVWHGILCSIVFCWDAFIYLYTQGSSCIFSSFNDAISSWYCVVSYGRAITE